MIGFYWAIKWKSFSVEDLLVNDNQKEYIENEWVKQPEQRKSQMFKLDGESYSYNSIDSITKTSKRITADVKLLYSAEASMNSKGPMVDENGDVVTIWCKKLVSKREYENYYGKHPAYKLVDRDDGGVWVGFRYVEKENGNRPDTIEQCNEVETERMWSYQTQSS